MVQSVATQPVAIFNDPAFEGPATKPIFGIVHLVELINCEKVPTGHLLQTCLPFKC